MTSDLRNVMTQQTSTGVVHLTERTPIVTGPEMLASLVPPPRTRGSASRVEASR